MQKLLMILFVALIAGGCKDTKKSEEVREDLRERIDKVGDKIDTGMDKVREKFKDLRDTVKSKIHRATAPDSQ